MPKNKKAFGDWGEDIATKFLEKKGFTILHRTSGQKGERLTLSPGIKTVLCL